jgi:AcrR family transcriptional regulator
VTRFGEVTTEQRKRRADAERNIAAIVDAALALFAERADVSMTDVARAAGVGRVTLYGHFPSRENLLEAVVDRALANSVKLRDVAEDATVPADEVLVRLARTAWRTLHRHRRLRAVAVAEIGEQRLRSRHDRAGLTDLLAALVTRGQQEGTIRTDLPAEWIIAMYYSTMHTAADEVAVGWLTADEVPDVLAATLASMLTVPAPSTSRGPGRVSG